jgi:hypothetical protein
MRYGGMMMTRCMRNYLIFITKIKPMKKLIILFVMLMAGCCPVQAQVSPRAVMPDKPQQFQSIKINLQTDSIINKDSAKAQEEQTHKIMQINLDSIHKLHIQATNERKKMAEQDLYGGVNPVHFKIAFIFALMAMFVRWVLKLKTVLKTNKDASVAFSWRLWIVDTIHKISRVIAMLCLVFIFLRFSKELLGFEFSMLIAVGIGFFADILADKAMAIKPETIFKKLPEIKEEKPITNT